MDAPPSFREMKTPATPYSVVSVPFAAKPSRRHPEHTDENVCTVWLAADRDRACRTLPIWIIWRSQWRPTGLQHRDSPVLCQGQLPEAQHVHNLTEYKLSVLLLVCVTVVGIARLVVGVWVCSSVPVAKPPADLPVVGVGVSVRGFGGHPLRRLTHL
ncbi:hypothetical protein B0J18DRAFT_416290, partial [Chaetomium sp. MPI-SDFR-AT-0129]